MFFVSGGMAAPRIRRHEMNATSATFTRILAGLGAVAMSLAVIVGTFATPHAATFAGVLA
jgi:hypothetical protein